MEVMSVVVGTALGIMAGTALLKVIETNKRIKQLQDNLKKGEEAVLELLNKPKEEGEPKNEN